MKDASIPTALIMRVSLVKLWELVEVDVDDLVGRWWNTVSATTTSSCGASFTMAAIF